MVDLIPLEERPKFDDLTEEQQKVHLRCLLVHPDKPNKRAICWSDDAKQIAKRQRRGLVIAQDPYYVSSDTRRDKEIVVVHVPRTELGMTGRPPGGSSS